MRSDAITGKARRPRGRATRPRLTITAFAALALALPATPASAGLYHPKPPIASFGPLGAVCPQGNLATGSGDLSAATGAGDLATLATGSGRRTILGSGKGDLTKGSTAVANFAKSTGTFTVGAPISGPGIPPATTIAALGAGALTLSNPATESRTADPLKSGSNTITSLLTSSGAFAVGASISGQGIPPGATITALGAGTLTLSDGVTEAGTGALTSGSKTVTNLATYTSATGSGDLQGGSELERETIRNVHAETGTFALGQIISGPGIPPETEITNVFTEAGTVGLRISKPATATATAVSLSATGGNFALGQGISGNGIPPGTTITALGSGTLTLSAGVTQAGAATPLHAGSTELTSITTSCGSFAVGQELLGTGIPAGTTITALGSGTLTLSVPATATLAATLTATSSFETNLGFGIGERAAGLAFDQVAHRLYTVDFFQTSSTEARSQPLLGFAASFPATYAPLAAPFPLSLPTSTNQNDHPHLAVDNGAGPTQGNIYAAGGEGEGKIYGWSAAGAPLPGFPISAPPQAPNFSEGKGSWFSLAVDPSGNIWAATSFEFAPLLYEYSPAGVLLEKISLPLPPSNESKEVRSLAFDPGGDLYLEAEGEVWRLPGPAYDHLVPFAPGFATALAVDPATRDLFAAGEHQVTRYSSGGTELEEFAVPGPRKIAGIALDPASHAFYAATQEKIYVFEALTLPDLAIEPPGDLGETSLTLNASVHPDGLALSECRFEWVSEAAFQAGGFSDLSSGGQRTCEPGPGSISTAGTTPVSAALSGLTPATHYRYRITAANANATNTDKGPTAAFLLAPPEAETVGSPIRTATSARLDSRVNPHGLATTYRFQYLSEAAYQENLAASRPPFEGAAETAARPAGDADLTELVSDRLEGLAPATTFRYRVVADNGAFGGPAYGEARAVETRSDAEEHLSHGRYPGPPGSDRAWEQVSAPDTSGNPVSHGLGIAGDGERALYQVAGGTPLSPAGTTEDFLYAHRPPGAHPSQGWQNSSIAPSRLAAPFASWFFPVVASDDLAAVLGLNVEIAQGSPAALWRMPTEGGAPAKLYEASPGAFRGTQLFSADGSRALLVLNSSHLDPEHSSPAGVAQLYDVTSGTPRMASLLPGAGPGAAGPSCGVELGTSAAVLLPRATHWLAADGSRAFFYTAGNEPGCGTRHLYMREIAAGETFRLDGPAEAGPECPGALIRTTANAAYFWTQSKLAPEDAVPPSGCTNGGSSGLGGDVYRYELASGALRCLTCALPGGAPANVIVHTGGPSFFTGAAEDVALAPDGSRLYFTTASRLLPGAPEAGNLALYRLDIASGALAYVAPLARGETVGENPTGSGDSNSAISPDGRYLVFASSTPALDPLSGSDNGSTTQLYLYDDASRSLICASCPPGGGPPRGSAGGLGGLAVQAPNLTSLAADGDLAFSTPTSLVGVDQNTAPAGGEAGSGTDVYEWRDGRALLVSDGLTVWPSAAAAPQPEAIDPSGRDLFFTEAAQLTPDALDGYRRLYDARVGGGIEFPEAAKPCALEVCQGTPAGAPEEQPPGTSGFRGPGNPPAEGNRKRCAKGKVRRHGRCLARHPHKRHRRATRLQRSAR